ncbi:MAG TPA: trypsin-like peptidase domain-containing protein [Candidatus Binatia bacterium]|nr:trypsin-like peptidase domain-containing protein [Candidatus Binatia bacterium]
MKHDRPGKLIKNFLAAALIFSIAACNQDKKEVPQQSAPPPPPAKIADTAPRSSTGVTSYAEAVERVGPGVVTIRAARRARAPRQHPFFNDPALRDLFGGIFGGTRSRGPAVQMGIGSGVIVQANGTILTNHHVVDGAEAIQVELTNNSIFDAKLIGSDAPSDLAVLKIEGKDLAALTLGDSDRVRVGDVALAVGNPLGIGQTVTAGIISAKGRSTGLSDGSFEDFLQTDAPINQGNSGGALVNTSGELIGINSQILSTSGGSIGIGFAIPSNMARNVMDQLIANGKVHRGQLGVMIEPVPPDKAARLGLKQPGGVLIASVPANTPAARAGLRKGDVVTAFQGQPVTDGNTLRNRVASTPPGTAVKLTILRDKREQEIEATLGEYEPPKQSG